MAGIIGIYGLVVSVLVSDGLKQDLPLYTGFIQLGAGLSVGLAGLAAGYDLLFVLNETLPLTQMPASLLVLSVMPASAVLRNNQGFSSA